MKKIFKNLAVVLVLAVLSCSLFACSGGSNNNAKSDVNGYWVCDSITYAGQTMDSTQIESLLGTPAADFMCFEIKDGGEIVISSAGEKMTGQWTDSGSQISITIEGESAVAFDKDGDKLKADMGSEEYIYMKKVSEKPSALN